MQLLIIFVVMVLMIYISIFIFSFLLGRTIKPNILFIVGAFIAISRLVAAILITQ